MAKSKKNGSSVGFRSFFKLNLIYGLALGQIAGLIFLAMAISGAPVKLNLFEWHIQGMPAAIGAFILLPPACGLIAFILAPVVFVPFTIAAHFLGGFKAS